MKMPEYELEEQKSGDTRQGPKGTERFIQGKLGNVNLPSWLGGRWVSEDEYQKIRTGRTGSSNVSTSGMNAADLEAAQKEANMRRASGEMPDLRGGPYKTKRSTGREEPKVEQPKVEQPKPTGPKLVWNPERMDFDTPGGKPAPYPTLPSPRNIDIKGLSAYSPSRTVPLSRLSVSSSSTPAATPTPAPAPATPKPTGVSDGLKKWASIYGPKGEKKLKQPTPSQSRLFKDLKMEAYDVVLDYLLSEGHADTVEEAHYVMMQLDSEYVQSIVESGLPIPPGGIKPDRLNPIDQTGKSKYKMIKGPTGKPREIENPSFGKFPSA